MGRHLKISIHIFVHDKIYPPKYFIMLHWRKNTWGCQWYKDLSRFVADESSFPVCWRSRRRENENVEELFAGKREVVLRIE